ncbi:hypothetical protein C9374_012619 [Naegleria lovaniensis]|uniref:Glycoside hydrolase family 31 protein n=1 Tax=Naegleria lovaniensis TaxID=51637 RepID=A0AA88H3D2_NAELO|nr:uncharacterized protein C9374_012619 [Naegleria lovaniensis]KAG2392367.1 hypothetical protein C9374_012619 [Naegleria lovaniensis]
MQSLEFSHFRTSLLLLFVMMLIALETLTASERDDYVVPPIPVQQAPYAEWAHHHWVWIDHNRENQQVLLNLVNRYLSLDIPVGAVDVDSEWSTGINNFVVDKTKFPNFYQFVKQLHSMNVKVICWTTSVVDTDSPNYNEGKQKGYYLNDGETVKWWHGRGSFIDYSNPDAVNWWHKQLDNVLILNQTDKEGIDGWKCDGTDPYVYEFIYIYGKKGHISEREYADMYYRDFFYYTKQVRGDGLIMARPVDSYFGKVFLDFAPRDVVFSGWVGDQDPTFQGMQDALLNMFHSAWNKYVGFGSDIGGYRGGQKRELAVFIRWFQMGAFNSLMENGGDGPHEPWNYDDATTNVTSIYRKYVHIHYELNPFFYSTGIAAYNNHQSIMNPLASWTLFTPDTWSYILGKDILVTPMLSASPNVVVTFPTGKWIDYFNHDVVFDASGPAVFNYSTFEQFPVFYRAGSIIPLNITTDYVNTFGNSKTHGGYLTLAIHYPSENSENEQTIYSHGIHVKYQRDASSSVMKISISAPNNFRSDYKNLKIMLDIRGLRSSSKNGFKISQYSFYEQKYVDIPQYSSVKEFSKAGKYDVFGGFLQSPVTTFDTIDKVQNNQKLTLKHEPLLIKLHELVRGVELVIQ